MSLFHSTVKPFQSTKPHLLSLDDEERLERLFDRPLQMRREEEGEEGEGRGRRGGSGIGISDTLASKMDALEVGERKEEEEEEKEEEEDDGGIIYFFLNEQK